MNFTRFGNGQFAITHLSVDVVDAGDVTFAIAEVEVSIVVDGFGAQVAVFDFGDEFAVEGRHIRVAVSVFEVELVVYGDKHLVVDFECVFAAVEPGDAAELLDHGFRFHIAGGIGKIHLDVIEGFVGIALVFSVHDDRDVDFDRVVLPGFHVYGAVLVVQGGHAVGSGTKLAVDVAGKFLRRAHAGFRRGGACVVGEYETYQQQAKGPGHCVKYS